MEGQTRTTCNDVLKVKLWKKFSKQKRQNSTMTCVIWPRLVARQEFMHDRKFVLQDQTIHPYFHRKGKHPTNLRHIFIIYIIKIQKYFIFAYINHTFLCISQTRNKQIDTGLNWGVFLTHY